MQPQIDALRDLYEAKLSGGKWVTINGTHVYIKGKKIVAGPSGVKKSRAATGKQTDERPPKKKAKAKVKAKKKGGKSVAKGSPKKKEGLLAKIANMVKSALGMGKKQKSPYSAKNLKDMNPKQLRKMATQLRGEAEKIRKKREAAA